ncbi:MAG: lytic transglycosylase domain-containing protein [Clostridia bacterium]|nr:lytic transglycosylase domain-containing protein [Clostridia bacterium]
MARLSKNKDKKKKTPRAAVLFSVAALILLAIGVAAVSKLGSKLTYPRRYEQEVLAASREYGLDPDLVFAVIRTESHFEPQAVSHAGAEGLMQIMPVTAEWIAWRRGYTHEHDKVFEPAYNIDMGCYLLSYLLDYYENDLILAVAAYNAGAGNVDDWLEDCAAQDGESLDIPFAETKNYVEKVLDSYEKYKLKRD